MTINWNAANNSVIDTAFELLKLMEANSQNLRWHLHSGVSTPTIGIGFDLTAGGVSMQRAVLEQMGFDVQNAWPGMVVQPGSPQAKEQGYISSILALIARRDTRQADYDAVMNMRAVDTDVVYRQTYSNRRNTFTFQGDNEVLAVFRVVWPSYQTKVFNGVGNVVSSDVAFQNSKELAVLGTLAWIGNFGGNISNAIRQGNRADAWYEARYGWKESSATINNPNNGWAKRYYAEGAMIGLYDDPSGSTATESESKNIYAMLTKNRKNILTKEFKFGIPPDGTSASNNRISAAVSEYSAGYQYLHCSTPAGLADELRPAFSSFIAWANSLLGSAPAIDTSIISNSCSVYYHENTGGRLDASVDDVRSGASLNNNLLVGGSVVDTLIGGGGDDYLIGLEGDDELNGGIGNDTLVGGRGKNTLVGGNGNDRYQISAYSNGVLESDVISDSDGIGTIWIGNAQLLGSMSQGSSNTWSDGAGYQYVFIQNGGKGKGTLTVTPPATNGQVGVLTIQNFDMNAAQTASTGYLGLHFGSTITLHAQNDISLAENSTAVFSVATSAISSSDRTIELHVQGVADSVISILTGSTAIKFVNGVALLTIPAGVDRLEVALVSAADIEQSAMFELTANLQENNTTVVSDAIVGKVDVTTDTTGNSSESDFLSKEGKKYSIGINSEISGTENIDYIVSQGGKVSGGAGNDFLRGSHVYGDAGDDIITGYARGLYLHSSFQYTIGQATVDGTFPFSEADEIAAVWDAFSGQFNPVIDGIAATKSVALSESGSQFEIMTADKLKEFYGSGGGTLFSAPKSFGSMKFIEGSQVVSGRSVSEDYQYHVETSENGFDLILDWTTSGNGYYINNYETIQHYSYGDIFPGFNVYYPDEMTLNGGDGNDFIVGAGWVAGGNGDDTVYVVGANGLIYGDDPAGGNGNDFIYSNGSNVIDGGGGSDTLISHEGGVLYGGAGNDYLGSELSNFSGDFYGEDGDDTIIAYSTDVVDGGEGNDSIVASYVNGEVSGGSGNDYIYIYHTNNANVAGYGGEGDDYIYGESCYLDGGDGNDTIVGSGCSFFGGDGENYLSGSGVFIVDGGFNTIDAKGEWNTIEFLASTVNEIVLVEGDSLVLTNINTNSRVEIIDKNAIGRYVFSNGESYTLDELRTKISTPGSSWKSVDQTIENTINAEGVSTIKILGAAQLVSGSDGDDSVIGGLGNDTLYGLGGDDTIVGGKGDDYILGGDGENSFEYAKGDGNDTIDSQTGYLVLNDISPSEVLITRDADDLFLNISGSGEKICISGFMTNSLLFQVQFSDGTVWTQGDLYSFVPDWKYLEGSNANDVLITYDGNDTLIGDGGDDTLIAGSGDDTLDGGGGKDYLEGGSGNDSYYFNVGSGWGDVIVDDDNRSGEVNAVRLTGGILAANVTLNRDLDNVYITIEKNGIYGNITLKDWFVDTTYQSECIVFEDGVVWDRKTINDKLSELNNNNNFVVGASANDTIDGMAGDDNLYGGAGNDWIYGGDGIDSLYGESGEDQLFGGNGYDYLYGGDGDDTLDAGIGGGRLDGGSGNDVFVFGRGYGSQEIVGNASADGEVDTVRFTSDVSVEDVSIKSYGDYWVFSIFGENDELVVDGPCIEDQSKVKKVEFADGTVWEIKDIISMINVLNEQDNLFTGTSAADSIAGLGGNDSIFGEGGDDSISGDSGDDYIDGGVGNDTIFDCEGNDQLYGGAGDDIILDLGGMFNSLDGGEGNDTIYFSCEPNNLVEVGVGNDVPLMPIIYTDILNNLVEGGAGNDVFQISDLYTDSSSYRNYYEGGIGNDSVTSGGSADTYQYNRGDGQDVIEDLDNFGDGGMDQIVFGQGVVSDQVWFSKEENDLAINLIGTDDQILVTNWFLGTQYHIEQFLSGDGKVLLDSQVDVLVSAMAAFTPPAAGQTTLPTDYQSSLNAVIAANWH